MKCPYCDVVYEKAISLIAHSAKRHNKKSKQVYIDFHKLGIHPLCKCGCGFETTFRGITVGFNDYVLGYASRVKNNWGNNEKAQEKSQITRKEMWKNGELQTWSKGKTKETSEKIKNAAIKASNTIMNDPDKRKKKSNDMRRSRLSGNIPTLKGAEHPQWKGGASSISELCHGNNKLYTTWKYPALEKAMFKCSRCNSTNELHVHHATTKMSEIIALCRPQKSFNRELIWEEKLLWMNAVIDWHVQNSPQAEVLCRKCHGEEHPSLNFK